MIIFIIIMLIFILLFGRIEKDESEYEEIKKGLEPPSNNLKVYRLVFIVAYLFKLLSNISISHDNYHIFYFSI